MLVTMGDERRKTKRKALHHTGMVYTTDGSPLVACELCDVSATGAKIAIAKEVALPKSFVLSLSHDGHVRRQCTIAWQFSVVVGVRFGSGEPDVTTDKSK
jgi:hypothetical protein